MHGVVDVRIRRDLRRRARVRAAPELAPLLGAALDVDTGRVELLRAVAPEVAGRADRVTDLDGLLGPVLVPVSRQVAGRQQRPFLRRAVGHLHRDVVADVRVLPPDARDGAFHGTLEVRVELGGERMVRVGARCQGHREQRRTERGRAGKCCRWCESHGCSPRNAAVGGFPQV